MNTLLQLPSGPAAVVPPAETPSTAQILVVDDNPTKRLATRAMVAPLGYEIVEADSGLAALRCLMVHDFAVILLDVEMPIMDGFETAALVRQRPRSEMTPIIFITAHASDEFTQTDRWAGGAVDFMFAPIQPLELRAKVSFFASLYIKAQQLAERVQEVQAYADQLRQLTDAAPIGIFQTDTENRYVYTNPRWSEISGLTADEALGREWGGVINAAQVADSGDWSAAVNADQPEVHRRVEVLHDDAPTQTMLATARPMTDQRGDVTGWVGTVADITAEAREAEALAAARDAALAATEMQRGFVASASHELRTPTTSILGFVEEVLDSEDLSDEDRGFLEIVYRNVQRLVTLIDDLLIVGQAEIGQSMMRLEPTPLLPFVQSVAAGFAATAQHGDVTLTTASEADLPSALIDPMRFEQVLSNLISNAIKFTPKGGEVTVDLHRAGPSDDTLELNVRDSGPGIAPSDIDKIFGRFYRTKDALDTAVKGSGLGLAIAKGMIEAQGGHISVTSAIGQGSTFTVTFPAAPSAGGATS